MSFAWIVAFVLLTSYSIAEKRILLIGDSLDRLIVYDYCYFRGGKFWQWGDHTIKYGGQHGTKMPSAICEDIVHHKESPEDASGNSSTAESGVYNNSIAFFHIFNSASRGPYLWIDTRDPYADTLPRIEKAIELYLQQVGKPTEIIFQSELWDARPYIVYDQLNSTSNPNWDKTLSDFRSNVVERVQHLRRLFKDDNLTIGLRTCPWTFYGGELLRSYNEIVRNITIEQNLLLYDYHTDVWSQAGFSYSERDVSRMFRDTHHPIETFSVRAGEALLGYRYTKSIHHPRSRGLDDDSIAGEYIERIIRQRRDENVSFGFISIAGGGGANYNGTLSLGYPNLHYAEIGRNGIYLLRDPPQSFLRRFFVGPGDVMVLSSNQTARWPISYGGNFPSLSSSLHSADIYAMDRFGVVTTDGSAYFIHNEYKRPTKNDSFATVAEIFNFSSILYGVDPFFVKHFLTGLPIPDIYQENSLIRYDHEQQVYVVQHGKKRPIENKNVFFSHGWEFDNVKVITKRADADIIPIGEPLLN